MNEASGVFKHHLTEISIRLPESYKTLNLQKTNEKKVSGMFYDYKTCGVSGDFTRVYLHKTDAAEIDLFKCRFRLNRDGEQVPYSVKHPSLSFKFFYSILSPTIIEVTSRVAGEIYPLTTKTARYTVEQLKLKLNSALKKDFANEDTIQHMINELINCEDLSNLSERDVAAAKFNDEIDIHLKNYCSRQLVDNEAQDSVEKLMSDSGKALTKTSEWKEVQRLEALLLQAKRLMRDKSEKIRESLIDKTPLNGKILAWRNEGSPVVLKSIEQICKQYMIIKNTHSSEILDKNLRDALETVINSYHSYSRYRISHYELDHIIEKTGVQPNIVMALRIN